MRFVYVTPCYGSQIGFCSASFTKLSSRNIFNTLVLNHSTDNVRIFAQHYANQPFVIPFSEKFSFTWLRNGHIVFVCTYVSHPCDYPFIARFKSMKQKSDTKLTWKTTERLHSLPIYTTFIFTDTDDIWPLRLWAPPFCRFSSVFFTIFLTASIR